MCQSSANTQIVTHHSIWLTMIWNNSGKSELRSSSTHQISCQNLTLIPSPKSENVEEGSHPTLIILHKPTPCDTRTPLEVRSILMVDNLKQRGYQLAGWCCMCQCDGETVNHLLLRCSLAYGLWSFVLQSFGIPWLLQGRVSDLVFGFLLEKLDGET